jgi:hypothetical protein
MWRLGAPWSKMKASALGLVSRREDAFYVDRLGHMPVFDLIGGAVECPAWKLIPAPESRPASPRIARESFVRAWGEGLDESDSAEPDGGRPPDRRLLN